jgi:hypothetical protein
LGHCDALCIRFLPYIHHLGLTAVIDMRQFV